MKFLKPYPLYLIPYTLTLLLLSCAQSADPRPAFVSEPPSSLVALGLPLSAYVTLSTDPEKRWDLSLDPVTNEFTGEVKAPLNKTFDLTVVYTADDPTSGETVSLAHYIRRGLTATGPSMKVAYAGDESNWEASFDLAPGKSNELNLDGDPYDNFIEVGYRSDPTDPSSLPSGPIAAGTHEDPIFGPDVSLPPPGSGETSALHGDEEVTIEALTPFDLQKMEVVSPAFGFEVLSTDLTEKTMTILLHTKRFVIGKGQMDLVVRATDKFGLTHDTTLTAAVSNPVDDLAPLPLQLGLSNHQVINDRTTFTWELDDPSGIDANSLSIRVVRNDLNINEQVRFADEDPSSNRFRANVPLDTTRYPDGDYTITLEAKDLAGNSWSETRTITVVNTVEVGICGNGVLENGEGCDDGNQAAGDGCSDRCKTEVCGDGVPDAGEDCDDGNQVNSDACTNACKNARCGDGIKGPGEGCDDGNQVNNDACTNSCQPARCGDAIIGPGEECDDGNAVDSDACRNTCRLAGCGDGVRGAGEECDDGNLIPEDGCSSACKIEPAIITLYSPAEGVILRDEMNVLATAVSRAGQDMLFFTVTDPAGLRDQDGSTQTFQSTWDVRNLPEDRDISITFQAQDVVGRTMEVSRSYRVDNVPNLTSFSTDLSFIQEGESAILSWAVDNFTTLSIDNGVGDVTSRDPRTISVSPTQTTTYTLTATRSNSRPTPPNAFSTSAAVTVRVNHNPVFDRHNTTALVSERPSSVDLSWTSHDDDAGDTITSTVNFYKGTGCTDDLIETRSTTDSSLTKSGLDPRTDYSYTVTLNDGNGGRAESDCFNLTTTDTGLVGWWRFNDGSGNTASDSSGKGHDGTLNGPAWSSGVNGGSLQFDGLDDFVNVPHHADWNIGGGDFTVEAWVEMDGRAPLSHYGFIGHAPEDPSDWDGWVLLFRDHANPANNTLWFDYNSALDDTNPVWGRLGDYDWGRWHQYIVTYDSGLNRVTLYYDGDAIGTGELREPINDVTAPLTIGKLLKPNEQYPLDGNMDEVVIYKRALSVDEVRRDCRRYESPGLTGACPNTKAPIILTPLPGQTLPPTRAYWSWRGERGRDGSLVEPTLRFSVTFDLDVEPDGNFDFINQPVTAVTQLPDGSWYYVESNPNIISPNNDFRLNVTPIENNDELPAFESTRPFSTDNPFRSWWDFENGSRLVVTDIVSGNDGALVGTDGIDNWVADALLGDYALQFDGEDDYMKIGNPDHNTPFNFGTGDFTLSSWVQSTFNGTQVLIEKMSETAGYELFRKPNNSLGFDILGCVGNMIAYEPDFAPSFDTAWHHVVAAREGGQVRLYQDGRLIGSATCAADVDNTFTFTIGCDSPELGPANCPAAFQGTMDDVIVLRESVDAAQACNSYLAFCLSANPGAEVSCDTSCVGD